MPVYWVTFRIAHDAGYSQRYDALIEAVRLQSKLWWVDPTSFLLFDSDNSIDTVSSEVKAAINPSKDLALIGMTETKGGRLVGNTTDQDLFALWPDINKV